MPPSTAAPPPAGTPPRATAKGRGRGQAWALAGLLAAMAGGGCDPVADRDYLGEPLAVLHGVVRNGAGPVPPLESALLWQRGAPPSVEDLTLATRAPVQSGFPATFTLRLYQPPPVEARRALAPGEVSWARSAPAAVPFGIAAGSIAGLPASSNPGYVLDETHWVVHLEQDVPPRSLTAWWLGAPLPAGYHLVSVSRLAPRCLTGLALDSCVVDLVLRGVRDDGSAATGTARGFCLAPYRVAPAQPDDLIVLDLAAIGAAATDGCP